MSIVCLIISLALLIVVESSFYFVCATFEATCGLFIICKRKCVCICIHLTVQERQQVAVYAVQRFFTILH